MNQPPRAKFAGEISQRRKLGAAGDTAPQCSHPSLFCDRLQLAESRGSAAVPSRGEADRRFRRRESSNAHRVFRTLREARRVNELHRGAGEIGGDRAIARRTFRAFLGTGSGDAGQGAFQRI